MATFLYIQKGDDSTWELTLEDDDSATDLTNASSAALYMREDGGVSNKIDGSAATLVNGGDTSGRVDYDPATTDVDTAGTYKAYVKVTYADNTTARFPSRENDYLTVIIASNYE